MACCWMAGLQCEHDCVGLNIQLVRVLSHVATWVVHINGQQSQALLLYMSQWRCTCTCVVRYDLGNAFIA
jgi:hypothetical protein